MLARAIPDSIMWKIINEEMVAGMWLIISREFESKTALMQADLRQRLHSLKCEENGNVRTHLEHLRMMREELASVGVTLSNDEYVPVIIRFVPTYYATFLAHLTASADLLRHKIQPDKLILLLAQEYNCLNPL